MLNPKRKLYLVYDLEKLYPVSIHDNWNACKSSLERKKGVLYKSFSSKEKLNLFIKKLKDIRSSDDRDGLLKQGKIYIDGSFNPRCPYAAWAWAHVENNRVTHQASGMCEKKSQSRNVDGELMAAMKAGLWCLAKKKKVTLHYDYEGVRSWALGLWKRNTFLTKDYHEKIQICLKHLVFFKVKAHSNDRWNDYVDELAKKKITSYLKLPSSFKTNPI